MPTRVVCTGCGKRFAVADDPARKKLPNCPTCAGELALDAALRPSLPVNDSDSILDALMRGDPTAGRMMSRPPVIPLSFQERTEFKFNWVPWACGGGVLLVALVIGAVAYSFVGSATSDKQNAALKLKIAAENRLRTDSEEADGEPPTEAKPIAKPTTAEKPTLATYSSTPTKGPQQPTKVSPDDSSKTADDAHGDDKSAPEKEKKKKPRVRMAVADLIDAVGDGVVHITVYDADNEPFATGSGFIVARQKVDEWIEPEAKATKEAKPMKGDLWLVATNYHVVAGSTSMKVRMRDGRTFEARGLAAMNRERDLAILALDQAPDNLTILEPAAEGTFRQGEDVVAIGHPKGFDFTVSTGIISAVRGTKNLPEEIAESIEAPADQQWIQTTAAITNGNSGGPLLTMFGEVVGINTWIINSGGNLAFASHVKHMVELQKKAFDVSAKVKKVTLHSLAAAKPIEAKEKIGDRDNWLESEVREELGRSTKRAMAIDWRTATKGDYTSLQTMATMLTIAAVYRYDVDELKTVNDALRKRSWQFAKEVEVINRFAVDYLNEERWGVFLFGKVRRMNSATRRKLWIELTGRGRVVSVTIPSNQPAPKLDVGDDVALFGYCVGMVTENAQLNRKVNHIIAGLITKVTLPAVPEDTALQAAYDLITHKYYDHEFEDHVRKFTEIFPRVVPLIGKTGIRWQRIEVNTRGRQFDAVRFSVPPELEADLLWCFNDVDEAIDAWGILPVGNFPMRTHDHHASLKGLTAPGLTREESKLLHLQGVAGGLLVPNEDYVLYFGFKDAKPRRISIVVRLVPPNLFEHEKNDEMGWLMREGAAFKPEMLARMTKALKEKSLATATIPATPPETSPPPSAGANGADGDKPADGEKPKTDE